MIEYQDDCVGCGLPCTPACRYHDKSPHYFCDDCGDECQPEELYRSEDGQELCESCVLKTIPKAYE